MRVSPLWLAGLLVSSIAAAQDTDAGRQTFVTRCAGCHGTDGNGGELGPNIAVRLPFRTDQELAGVVRDRSSHHRCHGRAPGHRGIRPPVFSVN